MPEIMKTWSKGVPSISRLFMGSQPSLRNIAQASRVGNIVARELLFMESYERLYLDLATEHRRKADISTDRCEREILLKLVNAYELAAESIRRYPEAA